MQNSYFLTFKDRFLIKEKKFTKIKVYKFWKLRFFYKFSLNVFIVKRRKKQLVYEKKNYCYFNKNIKFIFFIKKLFLLKKKSSTVTVIKSFFYKRMCRGQKLSAWLWYMFLQSFYGSFLETQFIYCLFGYFDIVSDTTSVFSEGFYPTLYFIFYFVFWKSFFIKNLILFRNWLLSFFFINYFFISVKSCGNKFLNLFVEKKYVTNFAKKPSVFSTNRAFASNFLKTFTFFIVKKLSILVKNLKWRRTK